MSKSDSGNFSATVTGGIQDISALLPLLGTEQCEEHVGSALNRGFLYSSITPVSIFGSLGIVRASFNILVAGLNIQRLGFLGATKLKDGGFSPKGDVAPMIALDPKHPKRFLAETRLEAMLAEEHIDNVEDLTVSWGDGIVWWNFLLITVTSGMALAGLLPYVRIILDSNNATLRTLFPLGFGFPLLRVVGSGICVNACQFLIQIRVLDILKNRLLFITIDRSAKESGIDMESEINTRLHRSKGKSAWNPDLASERCIGALRQYLSEADSESQKPDPAIKNIYSTHYERQMKVFDARLPRWIDPILVVSLLLGCCATVGGYVGCFYIIQHSTNSNGPLLWLLLEALLSIFRILVWAINPSWDDSKGIVFELQLASHAPLITCNKFEDDIVQDGTAPLTRSNKFLEDVVAYTGPFPAFVVPDVALYYILTAKGSNNPSNPDALPSGILYIVLSDHKEQTSRILFKDDDNRAFFSICISSLELVPGTTTINVKADLSEEGRKTKPRSHFLTSDTAFMDQLGAHYNDINLKIRTQRSNKARKPALFGRTWAMERPTEDHGDNEINSPVADSKDESSSLTPEDKVYLQQGQIERRWHHLHRQLEEWIEMLIGLYTKELLQDVSPDLVFAKNESVSIVQKYEANEVEFLLIECRRVLELLLIWTAGKWDEHVSEDHEGMVKKVVDGTFGKCGGSEIVGYVGVPREWHREEIRKKKMMTRLQDEREDLFDWERRRRTDDARARIAAQLGSTEQRIQARKYDDATGAAVVKALKDFSLEAKTPTDENSSTTSNDVSEEEEEEEEEEEKADPDDDGSSTKLNVVSGQQEEDKAAPVEDSYMSPSATPEQSDAEIPTDVAPDQLSQESEEASPPTAGASGEAQNNEGKTIIQTRRSEYDQAERARYEQAQTEANQFVEAAAKRDQLAEVEKMDARCRQRADYLFARLETHMTEFEELHTNDVLTGNKPDLMKYWSDASLQERKRLQDRAHRYLQVGNQAVESVGGADNMLLALKRSQEFVCLDLSKASLLTKQHVTSVVAHINSVTGVTLARGESEPADIKQAVEENIQRAEDNKRDVCSYANMVVAEHYRPGKPYLLFAYTGPGNRAPSSCRVSFFTHSQGDHLVTLRHCVTTSKGILIIELNGHELKGSWGQSRAVQWWFADEEICLPGKYLRKPGQPNSLKLSLHETSKGVCWLDEVLLPVRPAPGMVYPENSTPT